MGINYRKIKLQIKRLKPEAKHDGYIFIPSEEQKNDFVFTSVCRRKRTLIQAVAYLANEGRKNREWEDYTKHFSL